VHRKVGLKGIKSLLSVWILLSAISPLLWICLLVPKCSWFICQSKFYNRYLCGTLVVPLSVAITPCVYLWRECSISGLHSHVACRHLVTAYISALTTKFPTHLRRISGSDGKSFSNTSKEPRISHFYHRLFRLVHTISLQFAHIPSRNTAGLATT
jgi:hypothetical protein